MGAGLTQVAAARTIGEQSAGQERRPSGRLSIDEVDLQVEQHVCPHAYAEGDDHHVDRSRQRAAGDNSAESHQARQHDHPSRQEHVGAMDHGRKGDDRDKARAFIAVQLIAGDQQEGRGDDQAGHEHVRHGEAGDEGQGREHARDPLDRISCPRRRSGGQGAPREPDEPCGHGALDGGEQPQGAGPLDRPGEHAIPRASGAQHGEADVFLGGMRLGRRGGDEFGGGRLMKRGGDRLPEIGAAGQVGRGVRKYGWPAEDAEHEQQNDGAEDGRRPAGQLDAPASTGAGRER